MMGVDCHPTIEIHVHVQFVVHTMKRHFNMLAL
uniref:Uncharacterized protein n=1 Tax=Arundo donax TaxID=35708 RepID=A0A0A8ZA16_ARUDO